ncbi:uncharacterized protein I206_100517 [Kwoniella pini CBS 10737]|uniref:Uncharacterized protein n=1 Tax=Kwoniella pini CBS 10737 TaxID=1296096 RepID=A0A1B9ICY0_9TREE|nr:uncharacterized protein I206_00810 [Kwoniella pini CBS 10737]OCF53505.1 hypothetical protein I206_00810 [Kwoniella pini CBS 10737]
MDEDLQLNRGMFACFPCVILWRWAQKKLTKYDPEREPLFPSPQTILTPPTKKHRPNLPNLSSSGSVPLWSSAPTSPTKSGMGYFSDGKRNGSTSRLSQEGRERLGSISREYGGRMQSLYPSTSTPSTPSFPSTPHTIGRSSIRPLSSINPIVATEPTSPNRPSAPNLGRSASEPRNLSDLGFAPQQIPAFGSISVGRGGRTRSFTLSDRSPLSLGEGDEKNVRRGRSPGPAVFSRLNDIQNQLNDPIEENNSKEASRIINSSIERCSSHPQLTTAISVSGHTDDNIITPPEEDVVRKELGLRGLNSVRGKRGEGKGGKRVKTD